MEEQIESLLKEKEESTQMAITPITSISVIVAGTTGESTSATKESTSTTVDLNKVIQ